MTAEDSNERRSSLSQRPLLFHYFINHSPSDTCDYYIVYTVYTIRDPCSYLPAGIAAVTPRASYVLPVCGITYTISRTQLSAPSVHCASPTHSPVQTHRLPRPFLHSFSSLAASHYTASNCPMRFWVFVSSCSPAQYKRCEEKAAAVRAGPGRSWRLDASASHILGIFTNTVYYFRFIIVARVVR